MKFSNAIFFMLITFVLVCLSSCLKKGEDDPLISFRTRKTRLAGQWQLTSGSVEYITVFIDSLGKNESKTTLVYTENTYKKTTEASGYQSSNTGPFSYTTEFEKDGGYSSTTVTDNTTTDVSEGTWNFTKGIGNYKDKEQIVITLTKYSNTYVSPPNNSMIGNTFIGNRSDITYTIKELRNKKLVLVSEYSTSYSDGHGSSTKSELIFEQ